MIARVELANKVAKGRCVGNLYLVRVLLSERCWATVDTYEQEEDAQFATSILNVLLRSEIQ